MSKINRIPGSALERGKLIRLRKTSDPSTLAYHPENGQMVAEMYRRFRFEWVMTLKKDPSTNKWVPDEPTDEWVIIGFSGQCFEQGVGKLGITIVSARRIAPLLRQIEEQPDYWLHKSQIGDDEANFWCDWTFENIDRAAQLVKLRLRKSRPGQQPPKRPNPGAGLK
jgi:hypothetical protein